MCLGVVFFVFILLEILKTFGNVSLKFSLNLEKFSLLFLIFKINLFIYLFLAALGLRCSARAFSSCSEQGLLCCGARASHCGGFSCCGARALGAWASAVVAHGL